MSKTYYAKVEGFIAGKHRAKGDSIVLSEREARYPLMAGILSDTPLEPEDQEKPSRKRQEPDPATLDRKTR